jgi:hypothetical protein
LHRGRIGHSKIIEADLEEPMASGNAEVRENSIAELLSELSQESAGLLREELRLMGTELAAQGRRVGTSAGLLGGAGVLGLGAFGALTAGLIAALGRRPARGALLVATLYGAGAAALADAGVKRLGHIAPEAVETIQRDFKAAATGARKAPAKGARRAA